MDQDSKSNKTKIQAGLGVAALGIIVVGGAIATSSKSSSANSSPTIASSSSTTSSSKSSNANATYNDGTYTAAGSYDSPGGNEAITISMTLKNGVVTATSAQSGANDPTATSYQDLFISGYKSKVIGKKLSSINLKNVSGSSLTSQGFDSALKKIEQQAKAA